MCWKYPYIYIWYINLFLYNYIGSCQTEGGKMILIFYYNLMSILLHLIIIEQSDWTYNHSVYTLKNIFLPMVIKGHWGRNNSSDVGNKPSRDQLPTKGWTLTQKSAQSNPAFKTLQACVTPGARRTQFLFPRAQVSPTVPHWLNMGQSQSSQMPPKTLFLLYMAFFLFPSLFKFLKFYFSRMMKAFASRVQG